MKFPVLVKHRHARAKIYRKTASYGFYRLAYRNAGRRVVLSFTTYGAAKAKADEVVRDMAKGSQAPSLTRKEISDALTIRDALATFRQETGRSVTALKAVTGYLEAIRPLGNRPLSLAVESFINTDATVKREDVAKAVEEFIKGRKHRSESKNGKRAELSPVYAANVASWLREFAGVFPGHAVCDLTKEHLDTYIGAFSEVSTKSRNDRRNTVKMFLRWCSQRDYLPTNHRLFEAPGMQAEKVVAEEIDYYRPKELRALLDAADDRLRAVLALNALGGLRVEEILRLRWDNVWRVPGHVEVSAAIAKGRRRRLVEAGPALLQWLEPFRKTEGQVWDSSVDVYHEKVATLREELNIPSRRNGLRHGFCTYHFALHANENLTAALAGNSPAMIHEHYKGLATRADAEKWFAIMPSKSMNVIPLVRQGVRV